MFLLIYNRYFLSIKILILKYFILITILKKGIPIATITIISGTYNGPISSPVFPRYYPKKFNLLRYLENIGFDIDHYYHPDIWWN